MRFAYPRITAGIMRRYGSLVCRWRASGRIMYGSLILLHHSGNAARFHRARVSFRYGDYGATLSHEVISEIMWQARPQIVANRKLTVEIKMDIIMRSESDYMYQSHIINMIFIIAIYIYICVCTAGKIK